MSKKKNRAQIIQGEQTRIKTQKDKKLRREELSDLCRGYLEKKELFKWFIEKYYGAKKYLELWELAEQNKESDLRNELNSIWFELPDSIFNIQCAPSGWEAFLSLVDE